MRALRSYGKIFESDEVLRSLYPLAATLRMRTIRDFEENGWDVPDELLADSAPDVL